MMFDSTSLPSPKMLNSTSQGGSMHNGEFKEYIIIKLDRIEGFISDLTKKVKFSEKRFKVIEKALHIKTVTSLDTAMYNNALPEEYSPKEVKYPHIDASECTAII